MRVHTSLRVSAALAVVAAVIAPISSPVPRHARAASSVTLRFATWDTGNLLSYEKQRTSLFEKANPSIQVQVEANNSGFDEKIADLEQRRLLGQSRRQGTQRLSEQRPKRSGAGYDRRSDRYQSLHPGRWE